MGDGIRSKACEQQQGQLLPGFVGDALDPSDPVFFVDDLVEGFDLSAFEARYDADAAEAVAVRRDCGRVQRQGDRAAAVVGPAVSIRGRGAATGLRTINRFRERHREDFAQVLRETVRIARASGLAKLGAVAIDGTKIRANTSRSKAMSHRRMTEAEAQLDDEIAQILVQMDELNVREDAEHDDDDGSGGLPAELQQREQRRKEIRAAREKLAAE